MSNTMDIRPLHPGIFLQIELEKASMSQHDLAVRTGVTDKHISTVIRGKKGISASFARKLEYALGIDAKEWMNRQTTYDCAISAIEEENNITPEERDIIKSLKEVVEYYKTLGWVSERDSDIETILRMRHLMGVSRLDAIQGISYDAVYRAQIRRNSNVDPYVLYAWQRTCELLTEKMPVSAELNTEMLEKRISEIRQLMFLNINEICIRLTNILAECGIKFRIVHNFVGAPVQGFMKRTDFGRIILCITLRGKRADGFWFTLFHEIGHLLNGDLNTRFVDVKATDSDMEQKADAFARNVLLNEQDYHRFIRRRDFTLSSIRNFALEQKVCSFIVIGRLQRDEFIDWNRFDAEIVRYEWAVA